MQVTYLHGVGESNWDFWARLMMPASDVCDVSLILLLHFPENSPSISLPLAQPSLTSELSDCKLSHFYTLMVPFLKKCFSQTALSSIRGELDSLVYLFWGFLYTHYHNIYNSCFRTNWFISLLGCQREPKRSLVLNFVLFSIENLSVPLPCDDGDGKTRRFLIFFTLTSIHGIKVVEGNRKVDV